MDSSVPKRGSLASGVEWEGSEARDHCSTWGCEMLHSIGSDAVSDSEQTILLTPALAHW